MLLNGILKQQSKEKSKANDGFPNVMVTDEHGQAMDTELDSSDDESAMDMETEAENEARSRRRVRVPSSILSELYPNLKSPYYR